MTDIGQMRTVCQERITDSRGRRRLKGCWWNVLFSRRVSIYLTAVFVRFGVTANQVTGLMLVVGFLSFLCALPHAPALNAASLTLFLLFYILDCSDGEVARWTRRCSNGGVFLDYATHVVCNCPLLAAAALHYSLLGRSLPYALLAFATVMLALWAYYFKLIVPAVLGRQVRPKYSGGQLVPNRAIADAIRGIRSLLTDPVLPPMAIITLIIVSHIWRGALTVAAVYGLLSSLFAAGMYFIVGFVKVKRTDSVVRSVEVAAPQAVEQLTG